MTTSIYMAIATGLALSLSACSQHEVSERPKDGSSAEISHHAKGWPAKTLPEISDGLIQNKITSEALVQTYLERIATIDRDGPKLQSILSLNPNALEEAKRLDALRREGNIIGPLHGVPVVLKDNIETADNMATTAGALALKNNLTGRDSPLAKGLRDSGAIILGKSNLSQWANFRSENSMSGWSALGGQVRNPHMLDRNPCGSSSGSGVAVAASLVSGAVGTETNGSIICPSTVNGIVGFKPTVGLVSQDYIIPISSTQDTAGPMTKTVKGAAMMLDVMATGSAKTDYVSGLDEYSLKGTRVGVLRFAQGSNPDIHERFNVALEALEKAGAELVEIETFSPSVDGFRTKSRAILDYEFKATLNEYLARTPNTVTTRTLRDLITFNKNHADVELALFDQSIFDKAETMGPLTDAAYTEARDTIAKATRVDGIDALLSDNNVDVLVSPSGPIPGRVDPINGDVWPSWAGAGYLAAMAGYPHLSVPMGTVHGLPIGLSFIGGKDQDAKVLSYGYAYEQSTHMRVEPQYLETAEVRTEIKAAMTRK